jgi:hypothetical protein
MTEELTEAGRAQIVKELKWALASAGYCESHRKVTYVLSDADEYTACLDEEHASVTFWHSPTSSFNRCLFGPESDARKVQKWMKHPNPI